MKNNVSYADSMSGPKDLINEKYAALKSPSFSELKDEELLLATRNLVAEERSATTQVLLAVNEIELRRLHLSSGFFSLHEFMVHHLGYSDSSAHRRIAAARLLRVLPQFIAPALEKGSVNLTTLAAAQDFFTAEKRDFKRVYSSLQKQEVVASIALKSRRQCEEIFQNLSPERAAAPRPEKVRVVRKATNLAPSNTPQTLEPHIEVILNIRPELQKKLTRLKEILSHHPESAKDYASLFELMADQLLKRIDPLLKTEKIKKQTFKFETCASPRKPDSESQSQPLSVNHDEIPHPNECLPRAGHPLKKPSRYIPAHIKNFVHKRDNGQCAYIDPLTGKRCNARKFLHIDHVQPLALSGETTTENCRLLCSQHNSLAAIHSLGAEIMRPYLRPH